MSLKLQAKFLHTAFLTDHLKQITVNKINCWMSSKNPREPNSYYFKNFKTPDFKAFLVNFKFFLSGFSNFH